MLSRCIAAFALLLLAASPARAGDLVVISFNVESDADTDPARIGKRIELIGKAHLWGLSEVQNSADAALFQAAATAASGSAVKCAPTLNGQCGTSASGGSDRLAILYDSSTLKLRRTFELRDEIKEFCEAEVRRAEGRWPASRGVLVAEFEPSSGGRPFWFALVHLQRGAEVLRHCQARFLNGFARRNTIPTIAVGDWNFDWSVTRGDQGDRDKGYDELTKDNIYRWVRPRTLVKTYCSDHDSVLDFVFLSASATRWQAKAEVMFPGDDYCRLDGTREAPGESDHRPVRSFVTLP